MFAMWFSSSAGASGTNALSSTWVVGSALLLTGSSFVTAIKLDLTDPASIKSAASSAAYGMMTYYKGNETGGTPGLLPGQWNWWECGAMFDALINYWHYTGDPTYNQNVIEGLQFQTGPNNDFMPLAQASSEGNDDQAFWAFAAMSAAEYKFPNPRDDQPSWIALAQAVFNEWAVRWDTLTCNGGMKWQISPISGGSGYNYKNAIANGAFIQLGARLARYTGNQTYADWASRAWDWVEGVGLMSPLYEVWDGTVDLPGQNCSSPSKELWSYNSGVFLMGAAVMYNQTKGAPIWQTRIQGLLKSGDFFFASNVLSEHTCEATKNCNGDQVSFKSYLARWMALTTQLAPFARDQIMIRLAASATAAAAQCVGGTSGQDCGITWTGSAGYDGLPGVMQQMAAMEVIQGNLVTLASTSVPLTNATGGNSSGNAAAGTGSSATNEQPVRPITLADTAGAWILTLVAAALAMLCTGWLVMGS